jgi:ankyrin repeat protein
MPEGLHSISLTYYPQTQTWQLMDVNRFSSKIEENDLKKYFEYLSSINMNCFYLQPILLDQPEPCELLGKINDLTKFSEDLSDSEKNACLDLAVASNNLSAVQALLESGANPYYTDQYGFTPLYIAVQKGLFQMVEALLQKGSAFDEVDSHGCSSLHMAVQNGHFKIVDLLLKYGADVNKKSTDHMAPLHIAVNNSDIKILELLLKNKADPNQLDSDGFAPILRAVGNNDLNIVKLLLEYGASQKIAKTDDGCTPLFIAAQ